MINLDEIILGDGSVEVYAFRKNDILGEGGVILIVNDEDDNHAAVRITNKDRKRLNKALKVAIKNQKNQEN